MNALQDKNPTDGPRTDQALIQSFISFNATSVGVKPIEKANPHKLLYVNFSTTDSCAQSSSSVLRFEIASPKQSQKFWWVYISASAKFWCDTFTHRTPAETNTPEAKIHISSWSKIITALTGLSGPHIILPPLQFLIWYDIWIRWCHVHIFRVEAGLCLLSHRVTTGEMMTCSPCSLIRIARHLHRERCAISTIWSAGQPGFVSWALTDEWIISSHPPPSKHAVSKGFECGGHQIQTGVWREETIDTALSWIYEKPLQGETYWGKEKCIYDGCLQRCFSCDWCRSTGIISRKMTI